MNSLAPLVSYSRNGSPKEALFRTRPLRVVLMGNQGVFEASVSAAFIAREQRQCSDGGIAYCWARKVVLIGNMAVRRQPQSAPRCSYRARPRAPSPVAIRTPHVSTTQDMGQPTEHNPSPVEGRFRIELLWRGHRFSGWRSGFRYVEFLCQHIEASLYA